MNITEFRKFAEEIKADTNSEPKKSIENEQKVYRAVMSILREGEGGEDIINEALNLLIEFPLVLQLINMMAKGPRRSSQNPDFLSARALFAGVRNQ